MPHSRGPTIDGESAIPWRRADGSISKTPRRPLARLARDLPEVDAVEACAGRRAGGRVLRRPRTRKEGESTGDRDVSAAGTGVSRTRTIEQKGGRRHPGHTRLAGTDLRPPANRNRGRRCSRSWTVPHPRRRMGTVASGTWTSKVRTDSELSSGGGSCALGWALGLNPRQSPSARSGPARRAPTVGQHPRRPTRRARPEPPRGQGASPPATPGFRSRRDRAAGPRSAGRGAPPGGLPLPLDRPDPCGQGRAPLGWCAARSIARALPARAWSGAGP